MQEFYSTALHEIGHSTGHEHCVRAALAVLRSCCLSEGTGVPVDNIREEFGGGPVAAFSMSHPAVPALYIVLTLGLTMFSMQPVLIALSLAGGLAYGFATRGAARTLGALRWQLPVILIVALLNPLFSASGSTELFRIGMRAVYLEVNTVLMQPFYLRINRSCTNTTCNK